MCRLCDSLAPLCRHHHQTVRDWMWSTVRVPPAARHVAALNAAKFAEETTTSARPTKDWGAAACPSEAARPTRTDAKHALNAGTNQPRAEIRAPIEMRRDLTPNVLARRVHCSSAGKGEGAL